LTAVIVRALHWRFIARCIGGCWLLAWAYAAASTNGSDTAVATIDRVKHAVVAVGTYDRTRAPAFAFRGTGFAVGDGSLIATNAHVLAAPLTDARREVIGVLVTAGEGLVRFREARQVVSDAATDLALLRIDGDPLPPLTIGNSDDVREGQSVLFTGFPIGDVLGPYRATHRGMVAAISPIVIPQARSKDLEARLVSQLYAGAFPVFQLDATAYPGNSGSPLYDLHTGEVIGVINMVLIKRSREALLAQPSGITFAIPARHLRALMERAR
jgi:serine protease Do